MGPFQILLFVVWAVSAVALTILVLMHSGKGTGVSDMIASSLYNSSSATGVMEQNLDRLTVIMAVVFAVCVVLCMFFFPQEELRRNQAKKMFEIIVEKEGMEFLGWREVPTFPNVLGHKAVECMPYIMQGFVKKPADVEKAPCTPITVPL